MIQKTLLTIDNGFKLQPLEYVNVEDVINYIKEYKKDLLFTKNFKDKSICIRHDENSSYVIKFDYEEEFSQVLRILCIRLPTGNIKNNEKQKYATINGNLLFDFLNNVS